MAAVPRHRGVANPKTHSAQAAPAILASLLVDRLTDKNRTLPCSGSPEPGLHMPLISPLSPFFPKRVPFGTTSLQDLGVGGWEKKILINRKVEREPKFAESEALAKLVPSKSLSRTAPEFIVM